MKKKGGRRSKNTNLLRIAEAGVIGSIMTRNMMGTSLRNFITNENPQDGVTFMELLKGSADVTTQGRTASGAWSTHTTMGMTAGGNLDLVWSNTKANAMPLIIGMIGTPIIFKFGKKFARPVLTPIRGLLKGSGVTV
jgi:hypothetical protein